MSRDNVTNANNDLKRMIVSIDDRDNMLGNIIPMFTSSIDDTGSLDFDAIASGSGASLSEMKSRIRACGEHIERYCGKFENDSQVSGVIFDTYDRLTAKGESCLCLNGLIPYVDNFYDDPSFPFKRYDSSCPITWIKGVEITHSNDTWLPAQKVFYNYPFTSGEPPYYSGVSTGLACGYSYHHAALGALYEVIERDSFMLTWLLKMPGKAIIIDDINNDDLRTLYNHICKYLIGEDQLFIYDISKTKDVCTVLTYIRNDIPSAYGLIVSAASHLNPEAALLKSLEELCQLQYSAYNYLLKNVEKKCHYIDKSDVDTLHKHLYYYCTGVRSKNIDFISASGEHVCLSEMTDYSRDTNEGNLEHLIHLFRNENQQIHIANVTRAELSKSGFSVLKAIIPGYVDLSTSYKYRNQKSSRLQKYKEELGAEINSDPHPFS